MVLLVEHEHNGLIVGWWAATIHNQPRTIVVQPPSSFQRGADDEDTLLYTILHYTQPATTPLYTTSLAKPPSFQQNGKDEVIMKNVNWEKEEPQDNHGDANNVSRKYFFSRVSWQGKR